tara:strand:- start:16465 stop:16809 length:345 start_codon:yes stop_codon:yes gene_type:complete
MPGVTYVGAEDAIHCEIPIREEHSPDVKVNDIFVSRQLDRNHNHKIPHTHTCPLHQNVITYGSSTVRVNNRGCGRVGDDVGPNCTWVAEGSSDVFAGGIQGPAETDLSEAIAAI